MLSMMQIGERLINVSGTVTYGGLFFQEEGEFEVLGNWKLETIRMRYHSPACRKFSWANACICYLK